MTATIVTPTVRTASRRALFWVVAGIFVVLVAVAAIAITGSARGSGTPYSATDAGPTGSKALAQVLSRHGIHVTVAGTLAAASAALGGEDSTLLLVDPNDYLGSSQLSALVAKAGRVVLIDPTYSELSQLAPGVTVAGAVDDRTLTSGCDLPAARRAGTIGGAGVGYSVTDRADAVTCFDSGHSAYSVVRVGPKNHPISVIGAGAAFTNDHVADHGDAALALGLLGETPTLVWYLPTIDDTAATGNPSAGQLTPPWVPSVLVLAILVAAAAAIWRGRRMGPLVIENMPVVVRASETMEGRARLYQRGSARLHALDALRIGTIGRLAVSCGLSRLATAEEVAGAVAARTGRDVAGVRSLLLEADPANDRELVALSDRLLELERATARSVRPQQGE
ncbi:MAG: DUF4350 domain-containing protein [Actinomycetota bacterium]